MSAAFWLWEGGPAWRARALGAGCGRARGGVCGEGAQGTALVRSVSFREAASATRIQSMSVFFIYTCNDNVDS